MQIDVFVVSTPTGNLARKLLDREGEREGSLTLRPISLSSVFFKSKGLLGKALRAEEMAWGNAGQSGDQIPIPRNHMKVEGGDLLRSVPLPST